MKRRTLAEIRASSRPTSSPLNDGGTEKGQAIVQDQGEQGNGEPEVQGRAAAVVHDSTARASTVMTSTAGPMPEVVISIIVAPDDDGQVAGQLADDASR